MSAGREVEYLLTVNVDQATKSLRKLEALVMQNLSYLRRLTGDENINGAITKIQQIIIVIRQLIAIIHILEAVSGPIGWAMALTGVIGFGLATADLVDYDVRG